MDGILLPNGVKPFKFAATPTKPRPGRCADCKFSMKPDADLICTRYPPQSTVLLMPVARGVAAPGQLPFEPKVFTAFSLVQPDQGCWEFAPVEGTAT